MFAKTSLQVAVKTTEDGRKILIGILAGPTSKIITEYETYLLENLPVPEKSAKPTAPPVNAKRTRRYYDVPKDQHDVNNDGITYKKVLQRQKQPTNKHLTPAQPQASNNTPALQPVRDQALKPPKLPQPEIETIRKIRLKIREHTGRK